MEARRLRSKTKDDQGPTYMLLTLGIQKDHDSDEDFVPAEENGSEEEGQLAVYPSKPGRKGRKGGGNPKNPSGKIRMEKRRTQVKRHKKALSIKRKQYRLQKRSFAPKDRIPRMKIKKSQLT